MIIDRNSQIMVKITGMLEFTYKACFIEVCRAVTKDNRKSSEHQCPSINRLCSLWGKKNTTQVIELESKQIHDFIMNHDKTTEPTTTLILLHN